MTAPRICTNCQRKVLYEEPFYIKLSLCTTCQAYFYRYKHHRPPELFENSIKRHNLCECGEPVTHEIPVYVGEVYKNHDHSRATWLHLCDACYALEEACREAARLGQPMPVCAPMERL